GFDSPHPLHFTSHAGRVLFLADSMCQRQHSDDM
ncbi:uncharacterized protein METZ01_LOCUS198057, partial [marine metagenome]